LLICLRESAIEASAAATTDKISIFDAHKFKIAMWAAQTAERASKRPSKKTRGFELV
jgi:hypothetical protein